MGTEREQSTHSRWQQAVERQFEAAQTVFEQSLETQRRMFDGWMKTAETPLPPGSPLRAQLRLIGWAYDVWEETLSNVSVHADDAVTEQGIDLEKIQMLWLHAMDDAFSEVMSRPAFATQTSQTLERTLHEQQQLNQLRREWLQTANLPTDRDLEEVGERLLNLEARQKQIEEKLDAVLQASGIEAVRQVGTPR